MNHKNSNIRNQESSGMLPNLPPGSILLKIRDYLEESNIPTFRFQQLVNSLQHGRERFEEIKELPKPLREQLSEYFGQTPLPLKIVKEQSAEQVRKVLFETRSGAQIETVMSQYRAGWTSMCVSSQSGCGLGCSFCATGTIGLVKNLTEDEICGQVFHPHWQALPDSIAFMGMGEALMNPHFFNSLQILTAAGYGGISLRRITVSTVGVAPKLEQLVKEYPQVNITLSVHSPFPEQRAEIIPLEKRYPLAENLSILDRYANTVRRKVYLAYLLIKGVNDSNEHLNALVKMIKSCSRPELFHVSVIPYNDSFKMESSYQAPAMEHVLKFVSQLKQHGVHATRRQQFGSSIDAACGQLYASNKNSRAVKF